MPVVITLPDAEATYALGHYLGQHLPIGTVILLMGDLGSGKTTLVKGLAAALGITEPINSPTFTLINEYEQGRLPLYHVDLYRLEAAAADQLYLESYWDGSEFVPGIMAIEWSEHLGHHPPEPLELRLSYHDAGRQATLRPSTPCQAALLETLPDAILANEI
ncbi:tRNA (adenosine(37)-N6)-threonylcarbamoyltransferase complex ATPase subunit type 1 TsaE [Halomicronema hongdechloris]|nr:tRNA (adenosine(37)-N6)-threonylcarbamoyltransferase complex ATPase subunit type 1 TsaE [Halomicronema hongdechloris]